MNLLTALGNIHRDAAWWRKIMIGGALMMTILGYPFAAGLVVENMDNTRKGYPTPLPPWGDWSSRYLIGLFAGLIDFLFFLLPLLAAGLIFFCVGIGSVLWRAEGLAGAITPFIVGVVLVFLVLMFLSGVSAVGRLIFIEEGGPERAMSAVSLRETLRPGARAAYLRARLASLPAYIPALLVIVVIVLVARVAFSWAFFLLFALVWVFFCALLYAQLAVGQIYAAADQDLEARGLGRLDHLIEQQAVRVHEEENPMDIGKAFGFVTKDETWITKVLVGGLVSLIPIVGQFVVGGYSMRVAKHVARGDERVLPEWNEFGDFLMRGFMAWVIQIVYFLPVGLVYGIFVAITIAATAATTDSEGQGGAGALLGLCLFPLLFIGMVVCGMAALAAVARYIVTDEFSEAFKFGEVFAHLRQNLGVYGMLVVVAILASLVASLGIIACGVGVLFTSFYAYLVIGHALGQSLPQLFPPRDIAAPSGYPPVQSF